MFLSSFIYHLIKVSSDISLIRYQIYVSALRPPIFQSSPKILGLTPSLLQQYCWAALFEGGVVQCRCRRLDSISDSSTIAISPARVCRSRCHHSLRSPLWHFSRAGMQDVPSAGRHSERYRFHPRLLVTCFSQAHSSCHSKLQQRPESAMRCSRWLCESQSERALRSLG